jgi:hypothetical protein
MYKIHLLAALMILSATSAFADAPRHKAVHHRHASHHHAAHHAHRAHHRHPVKH